MQPLAQRASTAHATVASIPSARGMEDGSALPADLRGANLADLDLRKVDFSGRDLTGADLSRSDLRGCRFFRANLRNAIMVDSKLDGAELLGAQLEGACATSASFRQTGLGTANLTNADFFGADLTGATLSGATCRFTRFTAATLDDARLRNTDLNGAALEEASLVGADLEDSQVDGATFDRSDLTRSQVGRLRGFRSASWIGVRITNVDFCGAYLLRRHIMDENYLHEFRESSPARRVVYWLWWLTSDCGRSVTRWGLWTALLTVFFGVAYQSVDLDYGDHETAFSALYFSLVTLTTLGYGDVLPASGGAQWLVMLEVAVGYVMLGGLVSIFANKMARRAS